MFMHVRNLLNLFQYIFCLYILIRNDYKINYTNLYVMIVNLKQMIRSYEWKQLLIFRVSIVRTYSPIT